MKKVYCIVCGKTLLLSIMCSKCDNRDEQFLKKKNQLRY